MTHRISENKIPRSDALNRDSITSVDRHFFSDTNIVTSCGVVHQRSVTNQALFVGKSCISKKNLTIPRLELVSAHMASNLIGNVKAALKSCHVRSISGWTDSTVVLHCLNRQGLYKQFAVNRVSKILEKGYIKWYYVPIKQNPADIGSRGILLSKILDIWWEGPSWIAENKWSHQPTLSESKESEKEAKIIKNILATTAKQKDLFVFLLNKYKLQ